MKKFKFKNKLIFHVPSNNKSSFVKENVPNNEMELVGEFSK